MLDYFDEFCESEQYNNLNLKTVISFEEYLVSNDMGLKDMMGAVVPFVETLPVTPKTGRVYRTRLRRFIEFVCEREGINIED